MIRKDADNPDSELADGSNREKGDNLRLDLQCGGLDGTIDFPPNFYYLGCIWCSVSGPITGVLAAILVLTSKEVRCFILTLAIDLATSAQSLSTRFADLMPCLIN